MAVSARLFGRFMETLGQKELNLETDTIKVMLCTSSYVPDQDTHDYKSDVTNEVVGTGYDAGGKTLTGVSWSYNASTNTMVLDATDVSWTGSTIVARSAVLYDATPGSDATRPLIGYVDFGADVSTTAGTFQITWNASGIVNLTVS